MSGTTRGEVGPVRLRSCWLGRTPYREALAIQQGLQEELMARRGHPGFLLLLEHPPVITAGRSASPEDLLVSPARLSSLGVEFVSCRRGGQLTYHGPGQLVGYPVLDLKAYRADVHWYMRQLEEVLLRSLRPLGVEAGRRTGHTGVWVGSRKVASIGVALRRWVTAHGFALNVAPEMSHFRLLQPCGLSAETMTSLAQLIDEVPDLRELASAVTRSFAEVFGLRGEAVVFEENSAELLACVGVGSG